MEWFLKVVRDNYANFDGRARRKEYWMFVLIYFIIAFVIGILEGIMGLKNNMGSGPISGLLSLALLVPSLAVGARRLHDNGKSGWMQPLALLPIIGWIWLIVLHATEGHKGDNQYGADPKGSEFEEIGNN